MGIRSAVVMMIWSKRERESRGEVRIVELKNLKDCDCARLENNS